MDHLLLKEKRSHGSVDFPFHVISHVDKIGNYSVPHHWHDEIEIIYLEYGRVNIYSNEQEYKLKPGDFYIVNSNELHQILGVEPSLHHAIIFHPRLLDFNFFDHTEEQFIKPITSGNAKFSSHVYKDQDHLSIMRQLVDTDVKEYLSIKILIYTLINEFYHHHLIETNAQPNKHDDIKKVILYIQNNFSTCLVLDDIAKQINISPNHLCKYFKKKMGITVFQYINQYRISQSMYLLVNTNLSITDIALNCGFENISYYNRTFKKMTSLTPNQYRHQNKNQV